MSPERVLRTDLTLSAVADRDRQPARTATLLPEDERAAAAIERRLAEIGRAYLGGDASLADELGDALADYITGRYIIGASPAPAAQLPPEISESELRAMDGDR